jgi:hypothetical protein
VQKREFATLTAQYPRPQVGWVGSKRVVGLGGQDEPAADAQLMFELAWSPACIAGKYPKAVEQRQQVVGFAVEIDRPDETSERGPTRQ